MTTQGGTTSLPCRSGPTEERPNDPIWCPIQQIYVGGVLPENAKVQEMITANRGYLRIFGYGSLCWNPGTGALAHPTIQRTLGRAMGYRRCWAQKSTDHRGVPRFPGIVCTLLRDEEVRQLRDGDSSLLLVPCQGEGEESVTTEGVLYRVPPDLVEECLRELDFREKGGYARDVIDVIEDESGNTVQALLYRGTPDNPAIWIRAIQDLPFAAATIATAIGPSGENREYLYRLNTFLTSATTTMIDKLRLYDDTFEISRMCQALESRCQCFFLFGAGSNQHDQLLLNRSGGGHGDVDHDDVHILTELVLCTKRQKQSTHLIPRVHSIHAGGGHSGLLTEGGQLYLWGWNESNQLGSCSRYYLDDIPLPCIPPLMDRIVKTLALGFSHTLIIEQDTDRVWGFGDNRQGQVLGLTADASADTVHQPTTPVFLSDIAARKVAAGVFHSAVIPRDDGVGVILFGRSKEGQCGILVESPTIPTATATSTPSYGTWSPPTGARIVDVSCGQYHTTLVDEDGRVWTLGGEKNRHGQLGRDSSSSSTPHALAGEVILEDGWKASRVYGGWSHTVVHATDTTTTPGIFGWGRNDKGQLGTGSSSTASVPRPQRLFANLPVREISCGSESTVVVDADDQIWTTGWNEHGNLAQNCTTDTNMLRLVVGATVTTPYEDETKLSVVAGGGHMLAMRIVAHTSFPRTQWTTEHVM